jgi:uncharacterized protein
VSALSLQCRAFIPDVPFFRSAGWLLILPLALGLTIAGPAVGARAQELTYFRVGAGAPGTPIYEFAGLIGGSISNPPGTRPCDEGGSCGIPGMIGVAQTSSGSVENLTQLRGQAIESAIAQADIAYLALKGRDPFKDKGPDKKLRAIAGLGRLDVKILVPAGSKIKTVAGLKGRRVNFGAKSSDNALTARQILGAYDLGPKSVKASYLDFPAAALALQEKRIDAMIVVDAPDSRDVSALAERYAIRLLPIEGEPIKKLLKNLVFLTTSSIPENSFKGVGRTPTVELVAVWVVPASLPDDVAFALTQAIWEGARRLQQNEASAAGRPLDLELALSGVSIPFHTGALKFYEERGVTALLRPELKKQPTN